MYLIITSDDRVTKTCTKIILQDGIYNKYQTISDGKKKVILFILGDGKKFHKTFDIEFTRTSFLLITKEVQNNSISDLLENLDQNKGFRHTLKRLETNCYAVYYNVANPVAKILKGATCALPLYYSTNLPTDDFCIGSNPLHVASILKPVEINYNFLARYIFGRYDDVSGRIETALQDVYYILPREYIRFQRKKIVKEIFKNFFYDMDLFDVAQEKNQTIVSDLIKEKLSHSLEEQFNLRFDKNIGLALSSGIDSTTALVLGTLCKKKFMTFTATYDVEHQSNEFETAQKLANDFSVEWHPISINQKSFTDKLNNSYPAHALPMPTSSSTGYDLIYDFCYESSVDAVTMPTRTDNYFNGNYPHYLYNLADLFVTNSASFNNELSSWILNHSNESFPKNFDTFYQFIQKECDVNNHGKITPNLNLLEPNLVSFEKINNIIESSSYIHQQSKSYLKAYNQYDLNFNNAHSLGKLNAMISQNLEVFDPFNTSDLFNIGINLPNNYTIKDGVGKYILRELTKDLLPDYILNKKTKIGFSTPFKFWMKSGPLKELVCETVMQLNNSKLSLYFLNTKNILDDLDNYNEMFVWQLVNALLWEKSIINYRKSIILS